MWRWLNVRLWRFTNVYWTYCSTSYGPKVDVQWTFRLTSSLQNLNYVLKLRRTLRECQTGRSSNVIWTYMCPVGSSYFIVPLFQKILLNQTLAVDYCESSKLKKNKTIYPNTILKFKAKSPNYWLIIYWPSNQAPAVVHISYKRSVYNFKAIERNL